MAHPCQGKRCWVNTFKTQPLQGHTYQGWKINLTCYLCVPRNTSGKFVSHCYLCLPEVSAQDYDLISNPDMSLLLLISLSYTES